MRSEMKSRVPATDRSVSWRHQNCYYYTVSPAGREYTQLLRDFDLVGDTTRGQLLLDANELADDSGYLELGLSMVSPDERLLAYSVDRTGDEVYELRFRDLDTGEDRPDVVPRSYYGGAWSADSAYFFYTVHDEAYRPFQVWRHALGSSYDEDVLVLVEPDERFEIEIRATRSGGLIVFFSLSRDTREVWVLDAHQPLETPRSVGGRRRGVEYHAEHVVFPDGSDALLVVTNDEAEEFRLARVPRPPRCRPGPHGLGARAARGSHRAARARRRLRHARRAQLPLAGAPPAARAAGGRAGRGRVRRGPALRGQLGRPDPQRGLRRDLRDGRGRVLHRTPGLVGRRPAHRRAHRAAPAGRSGTRPRALPQRDPDVPLPGRHTRAR